MSRVEIRIQKIDGSTSKRFAKDKNDKKSIISQAKSDPDVAAIFIGEKMIWRRKDK